MANDIIKVPFYLEADGTKTLFLPKVKLTKGFRIGEKGAESYFSNYWEALSELSKMAKPRFRRRNKNNIPGIVACRFGDMEEVPRSYIEDQLVGNPD